MRRLTKPGRDVSRRRFLAGITTASAGVVSGCSDVDADPRSSGATPSDELLAAIEDEAVSFELRPSSDGLDGVADTLAAAPVVGIGESSHGVREFKTVPRLLVRRLVADHGYRLLAMEGTLGEFEAVNAYVTEGEGDLDSALSSVHFYFWRTDEIRELFEWVREFNEGRDPADRVVVRGYDAQFYDVSATAIRSYLDRVDPDYLATVDDSLGSLTTPIDSHDPAAFWTDEQQTLVEALDERLRTHEREYVERTSDSALRLARRHVWSLERALRFFEQSVAEEYDQSKAIRDEAMADNVAWLREWAGADRAVVMGNVNHTMRNVGSSSDQGTRMGQHLANDLGSDYYSLGMLFGTGAFSVPANHEETEFETFDLDGPVDGTLEATLAAVSESPFYLDFEDAREQSPIDSWIEDTSEMQVSFPRAPERGAVALPESPEELVDGVVFVREASPASFSPPG